MGFLQETYAVASATRFVAAEFRYAPKGAELDVLMKMLRGFVRFDGVSGKEAAILYGAHMVEFALNKEPVTRPGLEMIRDWLAGLERMAGVDRYASLRARFDALQAENIV